ncbi:TssQ family T6SS-associated lipoprotein [Andreprevotia sp. IGB-42]|uniref:TssQ family T6SS-associated lipoprotein n=1 Tax=Andreprevotia sp. IGB-42 TaxID=2497473 RepID=UPI00135AE634|nr:TssQ family T6SS-associated lipoprotein [Andreprevotia sp. IGB-42]
MAFTLTACQSPQTARQAEAAQPAYQRVAQAAVDEGTKQYEAGNFAGAIKVLSSTSEINLAKTETQVRAHKLLAFSYCASGKPSFCRAEFVKILSIDPNFKLSESERSHPIWGPIYESARK